MVKRGGDSNKLKLPKSKVFLIPASLWKRALAFILDFLLIDLIIIFQFRDTLQSLLPRATISIEYFNSHPDIVNQLVIIIGYITLMAILYFSVLQFKFRQTIGMMVFNIWLASEEERPSIWKYLISNLTFIPFFPFILLWIIDPLYIIFSENKQRLMQKITGLRLVEEYSAGGY